MSLKIRAEAHARKMKVISVDISFMGKYPGALKSRKRDGEPSRLYVPDQGLLNLWGYVIPASLSPPRPWRRLRWHL